MIKKRKQTKKEKELKRKLEALKANQKLQIRNIEIEQKPKEINKPIHVNEISNDDAIIITDDVHIKKDLTKTFILSVLIFGLIFALKYFNPLS